MNALRRTPRVHRERGFSLIELMVVIAIIAMLATVVAVNVLGNLEDASVAKAQADIKSFETAIVAYRIAFKRFPTQEEGLDALINNEKRNFLSQKAIPQDPWGNDYIYTLDGSEYRIVSLGADGQPGGSGEGTDIASDNLAGDEE